MPKQPESRLQQRIQKSLRRDVGGFWFKMWGGPFTPAGIPDLIGCVQGVFFALEVKRDDKRSKTSDIQDETIDDINAAGGCAGVVRSPTEAIDIVRARLGLEQSAIALLREIAGGHNDPRRAAKDFINAID